MGREIRRVPSGWNHPRDERGRYQPLYDYDFETEAAKWKEGFRQWEAGTHEAKQRARGYGCDEFWEYSFPPDRDTCRPQWSEEERTCYQIYETVSEGTPVSPVFETEEQVVVWLIEQGYSEHAAREFVKFAHAFSMVVQPGNPPVFAENIHAFDLPGAP